MTRNRKFVVVRAVKVGQAVRPSQDWQAYNASLEAPIKLDVGMDGYRVRSALINDWLQLEPGGRHSETTVVNVLFKDPDEVVEVL